MVSALIVNDNTFGSQEEANEYLANSPRTNSWKTFTSSKKDQSLLAATRELQKFNYLGSKTNLNVVDTFTVSAGGAGYAVGEILTKVGGTGVAATFKVLTLNVTAVATVQLLNAGLYSVDPPTDATTSNGAGTGATLTSAYKIQPLAFPRTGLVNIEGEPVDPYTVPEIVLQAEFELAFLIATDPTIEGFTGTSENFRRLKAGSVEVERFKPIEGTRLPNIVFELLRIFLEGFGNFGTVFASGTDVESEFDRDDRFSVTDGWA